MNDCTKGLGPRVIEIPEGDNRERLVCPDCSFVHYENPKLSVGSVASLDGKVLLCKRAIPPQIGFWTIPSGYLEIDETPQEGAIREALEEANAKIQPTELLAVYTIGAFGVIQMIFRAELSDSEISVGPESLEVGLFSEDQIPWDELSFESVRRVLKRYFQTSDQPKASVDFHSFVNPK